MSSFSCPHAELPDGLCRRLGRPCSPAQPGCVLAGKAERLRDHPRAARRPGKRPRPA